VSPILEQLIYDKKAEYCIRISVVTVSEYVSVDSGWQIKTLWCPWVLTPIVSLTLGSELNPTFISNQNLTYV